MKIEVSPRVNYVMFVSIIMNDLFQNTVNVSKWKKVNICKVLGIYIKMIKNKYVYILESYSLSDGKVLRTNAWKVLISSFKSLLTIRWRCNSDFDKNFGEWISTSSVPPGHPPTMKLE